MEHLYEKALESAEYIKTHTKKRPKIAVVLGSGLAKQTADELGIAYKEGVYMGFMGPCYETAAEIRAFAGMGADAVGMSTVPETMVCNYMGMKVLAVSCITNMATGIQTVKHSHARVLEIANQAGDTLCRWLGAVIQRME